MADSISDNLHRLNENIKSFAASTAEYYKLDLFNKGMKGATAMVKGLLMGFFFLTAFWLLSLALAIWISDALDSPSSGFFIIGGFYLLLFLLVLFVFGKYIDRFMLVKLSRMYFEKTGAEDEDLKEEEASKARLQRELELERELEFDRTQNAAERDETV